MGFARKYSDEVRAQCLALMVDRSMKSVSLEMGVPERTLAFWKQKEHLHPMVTDEDRRTVGQLLVANLETGLAAQLAMLDLFQDPEWLRRQDAHSVAVAYGIVADKSVRLMEASTPVPDDESDLDEG